LILKKWMMKILIDPYKITNYKRSKNELEEFLLFCIVVAGKTAYIQSQKLDEFLISINKNKKLESLNKVYYLLLSIIQTISQLLLIVILRFMSLTQNPRCHKMWS
jgi:hypothetical protein